MAESRRVHGLAGLQQAFDEVRFGAARTLNLRESLPTGAEAARRVEAWLRQHQVQQSAELLVITGRGNNSEAGIAVVREAAIRVFHELRRKGVVEEFAEHTPGSFVVTVAPMRAMLDAAQRRREQRRAACRRGAADARGARRGDASSCCASSPSVRSTHSAFASEGRSWRARCCGCSAYSHRASAVARSARRNCASRSDARMAELD